MPIDLGAMRVAVLAADNDTPEAMKPFAGQTVPIPDGVTLPTTLDVLTFNGQEFWGYARENSSTGNTEWVLTPAADPTAAMLDALPGPQGWRDQQARQKVRQIGIALRKSGVAGPDLRPAAQAFYSAVVAERDAQILAAGGTLSGPDPEKPKP